MAQLGDSFRVLPGNSFASKGEEQEKVEKVREGGGGAGTAIWGFLLTGPKPRAKALRVGATDRLPLHWR